MSNPIMDDLKKVADELQLQLHLAGMEARDRWSALQPRLAELERTIERGGERAGQVLEKDLAAVGAALRQLRDDIKKSAKS